MKELINRKSFVKQLGLLSALPFVDSLEGLAAGSMQPLDTFHVLTCNIRVALAEDEVNGVGWSSRREACLRVILDQKPDVIGFQEVLKSQFLDLKDGLRDFQGLNFDGPEMDAHTEGYHGIAKNPIFYNTKRFDLIAAGGYWLSETPLLAGSKSWETARARNVSWVRLEDKVTRKQFRVLSLHLDHVSNEAKLKQVELVLSESAQYQLEFPQILLGDFNAHAKSAVIGSVFAAGWQDSFVQANGDIDPGATVHSFKGLEDPKRKDRKKIDFIFLKGDLETKGSNIIRDSYRGIYPSDHFFLGARLKLT